ncbi:MAG: TPM domain-containing protein [Terracidiphilus sp.]|jgi:uncharacterized protein
MKGFYRSSMTALRLLVAVLLGCSASAVLAEKVEDLPKPTDYVSDYAHVLSPQAIARLDSICAQLDHSAANAQIAVVTVHSLDGDDSADFATNLYEKMQIGKKGSDRGILLLFAINDHRRSIKVGYGLEGILTDAKTGDIGRDMVPYLRANDFDSAVTLGVGEIAQVIAADAKVTLQDQPVGRPVQRVSHHHSGGGIVFMFIWLAIIFGSWILRLIFGGRRGYWGGGPGIWFIGGGGGFGGGGGGFGGGDGGGGGFGGFGGGSTGGGGSDGSW